MRVLNGKKYQLKSLILFLIVLFFIKPNYLLGQDSPSFDLQRQKMAIELSNNIDKLSERVRNAFLTTPRHRFVPEHYRSMAYTNNPIPLTGTAILPSPQILAEIFNEANLTPSSKVLISGSGTGYSVMLLTTLVTEVFVADPSFDGTITKGVTVSRSASPLAWINTAPFDFIFIHTAVKEIPPGTLEMLKPGGILAAPLIDKSGIQTVVIFQKTEGDVLVKSIGSAIFSSP